MTRSFFSVWQLWVSLCSAPSLTRGWVCNLLVQLLLGLARAVTLGSKSRRTRDHIFLSHLRLPQPGGPGSRIYIPREQGGPVIPPGTGFDWTDLSLNKRSTNDVTPSMSEVICYSWPRPAQWGWHRRAPHWLASASLPPQTGRQPEDQQSASRHAVVGAHMPIANTG
jgi:hypothetical protein